VYFVPIGYGLFNRAIAYRDKVVGVFVRFRAPLHRARLPV
jgi:hypothetical protein